MSMWSTAAGDYGMTSMEADPLGCSDPPAESCSDAGCPVHGDRECRIDWPHDATECDGYHLDPSDTL
jgi:hypothetical protein